MKSNKLEYIISQKKAGLAILVGALLFLESATLMKYNHSLYSKGLLNKNEYISQTSLPYVTGLVSYTLFVLGSGTYLNNKSFERSVK